MQRFSALIILVVLLVLSSLAVIFENSADENQPRNAPAVVLESTHGNNSELLPQDNELCIICHLYFDDEPLANDHLNAGLTCMHCHGRSADHHHDETMMTSPDILYGRTEVDALCQACHQPHQNPQAVELFRQKWPGKKRENGRTITPASICTDCHGLHTISRR